MALNTLLSEMKGDSGLNGALGGADGGILVSRFTRTRAAHTLLRTGGLSAIAGLAWLACSNYRASHAPKVEISLPVISRQQFDAVLSARHESASIGLVLQAMIAAAHADQRFSESEQTQIWQCAMDLGATGAELAALTQTMARAPSLDDVANAARSLESRIIVYTASFLVIGKTNQSGQMYLQQLAKHLQLPSLLVASLEHPLNTELVAA